MNKELLSIKIKLNNIVKDILSVYGLKQKGKWIYSTTSNNSYYELNQILQAWQVQRIIMMYLSID